MTQRFGEVTRKGRCLPGRGLDRECTLCACSTAAQAQLVAHTPTGEAGRGGAAGLGLPFSFSFCAALWVVNIELFTVLESLRHHSIAGGTLFSILGQVNLITN